MQTQHTARRPSTLGWLCVMAALLTHGTSQAATCTGEEQAARERLRGRCMVLLSEAARAFELRLPQLWQETVAAVRLVAVWQARADFLDAVERQLDGTLVPTFTSLRGTLGPVWNRAGGLLHRGDPSAAESWAREADTLFLAISSSLAVCEAVRSGSSEPCGQLPEEPNHAREECVQRLVLYGVLFQHRCGAAELEAVSRSTGASPEQAQALKSYCQALATGDPRGCEGLAGLPPPEVVRCRALASVDPQACAAAQDGDDATARCQRVVREYTYARRLTHQLPGSSGDLERLDVDLALASVRYPGERCAALLVEGLRRITAVRLGGPARRPRAPI
ncbi:MAG TPA: hypothetical protein PK668_13735 [Myxococcota bacterium]|nr:hypothetical protein [Myxococcota bacterium]HRY94076.1 hypothetical protein [Myxococcota bacterium]HSA23144.1 hypothetical protein [Myxococcota bacterium]